MKIMMADGKEVTTSDAHTPTYIVTSNSSQDNAPKKGGITKKHVLLSVSAVVIVALVLVAILVGMNMFSQAQKEIVKFSLQFKGSNDETVKQDVESDPNDNVLLTTVNKGGKDAYIVSDFNRGMQVIKMATPDGVSCFVSALNKTVAMDPLHITGPDSMSGKGGSIQESFLVSSDPVVDRSFLAKKAQDLCKGLSLYWVTRHCPEKVDFNSTDVGRNKRAIWDLPRLYGLIGLGGCCKAYWACGLIMVERIVGNFVYCDTLAFTRNCCNTPSAVYPFGIPEPYCLNVYTARHPTPGLLC